MTEQPVSLEQKPQRLMSLDALRGMTIAGMLLVNNPGSWNSENIYGQLEHAEWNGWTFTDLIFPFFLFMVGVAMMFSFPKRMARGESRRDLFGHVMRRAFVLWLLGVFSIPFIPSTAEGFFPALMSLGVWGNVARWALVWCFLCAVVLITGSEKPRFWFGGYLVGAVLVLTGLILTNASDEMLVTGWQAIVTRCSLEIIAIGALMLLTFPKVKLVAYALLGVGTLGAIAMLPDPSLRMQAAIVFIVIGGAAVLTHRREDDVKYITGALAALALVLAVAISAGYDPLWRWLTDRRLLGVLARIGLCYLFASAIYFATPKPKAIIAWIVALLGIYWVWMLYIPIPGFGRANLEMAFPTSETPLDQLFSNWCFYIDYHVLGNHVWGARTLYNSSGDLIWSFDPEGLLSTMSAVCSVLFGILTGLWLQRSDTSPIQKTRGLLIWGVILCVIGLVMDIWFPINKRIWTSSYTVFMAGMALVCLSACHYLIDVRSWRRWAMPFVWFGMNAITAFFFSGQMAVMLGRLKISVMEVNEAGETVTQIISWKTWIFQILCGFAEPINASLMFAIGFVLFWTVIMGILHWRKIFLKI